MGGWKSKILFLLVVYFAGFATAIYTLAPMPEDYSGQFGKEGFSHSALESDEFVQSFNVGMHKCLDFTKYAALRVSRFIKQKLNERKVADK